MSVNKLVKFLGKPRIQQGNSKTHTPVVLTDSKGNWLKRKAEHRSERDIIWWAKSSDKIKNRFDWLEANIVHEIKRLGNIRLYVWLGTCDLTTKNKKFISVTSPHGDETIDYILSYYRKIEKLMQNHPNSRVTFLEIPLYSIYEYNKQKNHTDLDQFTEQDIELNRQIYKLNQEIREINRAANCHSPSFTSDLIYKTTVKKGGHRRAENKKKHNFQLLVDGIHPTNLLAETWVRRIAEKYKEDCWT